MTTIKYTCVQCGTSHSTYQIRDNPEQHQCQGHKKDLNLITELQGFLDKTPSWETYNTTLNPLFSAMKTVRLLTVWENSTPQGYQGNNELIGQHIYPDGSKSPWKPVSDAFWMYLHTNTPDYPLEAVETFLDTYDHPIQKLRDYAIYETHHAAYQITP